MFNEEGVVKLGQEKETTIRLNVKIKNRRQILKLLRNNKFVSRVDMAKELGLTRSAITIITKEMIEEGLIRETSNYPIDFTSGPGPNRIYLEISPDFRVVFGVAVERKIVSIGLTNLNGSILGKRYYNLQDTRNVTYLLKTIISGCNEILEENCLSTKEILAMGICLNESFFEGTMDKEDLYSEISDIIKKQLGVFVCFDELTNGLALADIDFYCSHNVKDSSRKYLYICNEKNINASFIIKNSSLEDYIFNKVDFGNMVYHTNSKSVVRLDKLDSINKNASVLFLKKIIDKIYYGSKDTDLYKSAKEKGMSISDLVLFDSSVNLDSAVLNIFYDACESILAGIYNCSKLFDVEKIMLFGRIFENLTFVECFNNCLETYVPKELFEKVCISKIHVKTNFLSGCAIAVKDGLIKYGGYDPILIKNIGKKI